MARRNLRAAFAASSLAPIGAGMLAAAIFVADTVTGLEIAVAVFYVTVVLISVGFCQKRGVRAVAAGCMVLTLASHLLTPGGESNAGLVNGAISLLAIGATTCLALKIGSSQVAVHEARAQLAHIARLTTLGEMTASIAHEVNQPLGAIVANGYACLRWLAGQPPNLAKATQAVERIVDDANRANEVVCRVRSLAKRVAPQTALLSINETVLEIVALTQSEIQRNRISLRTQLTSDLPHVRGDRILLQQVILNLILNAIDAINATIGGPRQVIIGTEKDEANGVLVTVQDSGAGLKPGRQDHLFGAFYSTKATGLGMGLTISRSIIEAHGGRVWATASCGGGAVLQFTLPAAREAGRGG